VTVDPFRLRRTNCVPHFFIAAALLAVSVCLSPHSARAANCAAPPGFSLWEGFGPTTGWNCDGDGMFDDSPTPTDTLLYSDSAVVDHVAPLPFLAANTPSVVVESGGELQLFMEGCTDPPCTMSLHHASKNTGFALEAGGRVTLRAAWVVDDGGAVRRCSQDYPGTACAVDPIYPHVIEWPVDNVLPCPNGSGGWDCATAPHQLHVALGTDLTGVALGAPFEAQDWFACFVSGRARDKCFGVLDLDAQGLVLDTRHTWLGQPVSTEVGTCSISQQPCLRTDPHCGGDPDVCVIDGYPDALRGAAFAFASQQPAAGDRDVEVSDVVSIDGVRGGHFLRPVVDGTPDASKVFPILRIEDAGGQDTVHLAGHPEAGTALDGSYPSFVVEAHGVRSGDRLVLVAPPVIRERDAADRPGTHSIAGVIDADAWLWQNMGRTFVAGTAVFENPELRWLHWDPAAEGGSVLTASDGVELSGELLMMAGAPDTPVTGEDPNDGQHHGITCTNGCGISFDRITQLHLGDDGLFLTNDSSSPATFDVDAWQQRDSTGEGDSQQVLDTGNGPNNFAEGRVGAVFLAGSGSGDGHFRAGPDVVANGVLQIGSLELFDDGSNGVGAPAFMHFRLARAIGSLPILPSQLDQFVWRDCGGDGGTPLTGLNWANGLVRDCATDRDPWLFTQAGATAGFDLSGVLLWNVVGDDNARMIRLVGPTGFPGSLDGLTMWWDVGIDDGWVDIFGYNGVDPGEANPERLLVVGHTPDSGHVVPNAGTQDNVHFEPVVHGPCFAESGPTPVEDPNAAPGRVLGSAPAPLVFNQTIPIDPAFGQCGTRFAGIDVPRGTDEWSGLGPEYVQLPEPSGGVLSLGLLLSLWGLRARRAG